MDDNDTRLAKSRAAVRELERSLQRLERAVANHRGDLFLAEELRDARDAYSRLESAAQTVEARLGDMVDRLRTALEG